MHTGSFVQSADKESPVSVIGQTEREKEPRGSFFGSVQKYLQEKGLEEMKEHAMMKKDGTGIPGRKPHMQAG